MTAIHHDRGWLVLVRTLDTAELCEVAEGRLSRTLPRPSVSGIWTLHVTPLRHRRLLPGSSGPDGPAVIERSDGSDRCVPAKTLKTLLQIQ